MIAGAFKTHRDGSSAWAGAAFPSVASQYESLAALKAAIVTPDTPTGFLLGLDEQVFAGDPPRRVNLSALLTDAEDETAEARIYLVSALTLPGSQNQLDAVLCELLGLATFTAGATALGLGTLTASLWAKTVTFASEGVLEARTGLDPVVTPATYSPASLSLRARGPCQNVLVVPRVNTAASIVPVSQVWS